MSRWKVSALIVSLLMFAIVGVAYAPYHTQTPPSPAGGAAFKNQAKTASQHAGFAADSGTMSGAKEHIGHAIVCMEGPRGKNVNAAWENPCAGQGNGVLADLQTGPQGAAWLLVAQSADSLAVAALNNNNLTQVKNAAQGVSELMRLIAETK